MRSTTGFAREVQLRLLAKNIGEANFDDLVAVVGDMHAVNVKPAYTWTRWLFCGGDRCLSYNVYSGSSGDCLVGTVRFRRTFFSLRPKVWEFGGCEWRVECPDFDMDAAEAWSRSLDETLLPSPDPVDDLADEGHRDSDDSWIAYDDSSSPSEF